MILHRNDPNRTNFTASLKNPNLTFYTCIKLKYTKTKSTKVEYDPIQMLIMKIQNKGSLSAVFF